MRREAGAAVVTRIVAFEDQALLLLSALEMARMLRDERERPDFETLLRDLNRHKLEERINKFEGDANRPDFSLYFGPFSKRNFKRGGKMPAFNYFIDFLSSEIFRLPRDTLSPPLALLAGKGRSDIRKSLRSILNGKIDTLISQISRDRSLPAHPTLKWASRDGQSYTLPAYSAASLRLLLCGFSAKFRTENKEAGVFYVFREPRNVFAEKPTQLAALIRDVLWLRHTDGRWHDGKSHHFGYYFGALSGDVYAITSVDQLKGGQLYLLGRELGPAGSKPPLFSLIVPPQISTELMSVRFGLVAGAAKLGNKRPAAGKIAVVKTDVNDEQLEKNLETIFSQQRLFKESVRARSAEVERVFAILDYLQAEGHVGVLASHKFASGSQDALRTLLTLRHSFKSLVAMDKKDLVIDTVTKRMFFDLLNPEVQTNIQTLRQDPSVAKSIDEVITGILKSWAMLESLSIIVPKSEEREQSSRAIRQRTLVKTLVEAKPVAPSVTSLAQLISPESS